MVSVEECESQYYELRKKLKPNYGSRPCQFFIRKNLCKG